MNCSNRRIRHIGLPPATKSAAESAAESASESAIQAQQIENLVLSLGAKEHRKAIEESVRKKMTMKQAMTHVS